METWTRPRALRLAHRAAHAVIARRDARLLAYLCARLARTRSLTAPEIETTMVGEFTRLRRMQRDILAQSALRPARAPQRPGAL